VTANLPRSRPVVVWMSILAALQVMSAGSALADVVPSKAAALFSLGVAAAQAGIQFFVQAQVTPWETVVAKENETGQVVAGPASELPTGTVVEPA
jgi:hypothetical protein